jgi:hypothetical protein
MHWPGKKKCPGGLAEFHSVVGPAAVLELVRTARSAVSDEDLQELGRLLEELTAYVKVVPDETGAARSTSRTELVLRARQLRSLIGI